MPRFNLDDYEPIEDRIKRFYLAHADGRIETACEVPGIDGKWLFKASVFENADQQERRLPKATGYASETEGGPQTEWKAELGETSAIGRALANAGFSGNKRASREEMQKVNRAERDFVLEASRLEDVDALRLLYAEAKAAGATKLILDKVAARAKSLGNSGSKSDGAV